MVTDYDSLVGYLEAEGFTVEVAGEGQELYFSVPGTVLRVDGELVRAFEYADAHSAAKEAERISPDGSTVQVCTDAGLSATSLFWMALPHFYRSGKLIVLYVGWDAPLTEVLEAALGPQFAGSKAGGQ